MRCLLWIAVLLPLLFVSRPSEAQTWKWRDAKGQVHASDLPPPRDVADKDILQRPAPTRVPARPASAPAGSASAVAQAASAPRTDPELERRRGAAEAEKNAKAKADEAQAASQRRENCQSARSHLSALESGMRIARVNDKGEREVLDDRGRAAEMQRARQVIASDCR
jgi:hypothetical protein